MQNTTRVLAVFILFMREIIIYSSYKGMTWSNVLYLILQMGVGRRRGGGILKDHSYIMMLHCRGISVITASQVYIYFNITITKVQYVIYVVSPICSLLNNRINSLRQICTIRRAISLPLLPTVGGMGRGEGG